MKYIKYITILFFVFVLFFVNNSSVPAATCYTNTTSGYWSLCDTDPTNGLPINCINTGGGGSQETYECCLSAGTSTCEAPTGGGGGRGCSWSQVNCPVGGTRTNQVAAVSCGSTHCPAPGTAQAVTGCCGEGKYDEEGWYCGNQQVTTYSCCPPNTTPKETLVSGGNLYHRAKL